MKNVFFEYKSHASQVPGGNSSSLNFVAQVDLNWARPTDQVGILSFPFVP